MKGTSIILDHDFYRFQGWEQQAESWAPNFNTQFKMELLTVIFFFFGTDLCREGQVVPVTKSSSWYAGAFMTVQGRQVQPEKNHRCPSPLKQHEFSEEGKSRPPEGAAKSSTSQKEKKHRYRIIAISPLTCCSYSVRHTSAMLQGWACTQILPRSTANISQC